MNLRTVNLQSENGDYQHIETLKRNREKRTHSKEFFVEGVNPIERAVAARWPIRCLLCPRGRRLSSWALGILDNAGADVLYVVRPDLFAKLSDKHEPGELLAVARMLPDSFERVRNDDPSRWLAVVVDRPASPGNLGTLIRSADSFRAQGVVLTGHAADPWDTASIRASVGAVFAVPVLRVDSPRQVLAWAEQVRAVHPQLRIVGTSARADRDIADEDWQGPRLLLLGNETDGLCRAYKEAADSLVRIPIHGVATSLNVAVAGSILLYEIDRQRRRRGHSSGNGTS